MKFPTTVKNFSSLAQRLHSEGPQLKTEITSLVRDCLGGKWCTANSNNVIVKRIRGGLSNSVFQVTLSASNEKCPKYEPNTVIVRYHQPLNLDSVFEYVSQLLAFMFLSEKKCGPKLHAIFPGGRIEEFIDARPLTTEELIHGKFSSAIAEKMAVFHSLNPPLSRKSGKLFDVMENWLTQIKTENFCWKANNSDAQKCVEFFKQLDLTKEISWLRNILEKIHSPIVFCHNDIQEGNLLVSFESDSSVKPVLTLIDYDYCFYNYQAFELANYFLEYTMCYETKDCSHFVVNEENYPSKEHQLMFIRRYLTVKDHLQKVQSDKKASKIPFHLLLDSIPDCDEVKVGDMTERESVLLQEVSKFRMASHLFWGIWSALRSQSHISFAYWEYCHSRLQAYYKLKEELKD